MQKPRQNVCTVFWLPKTASVQTMLTLGRLIALAAWSWYKYPPALSLKAHRELIPHCTPLPNPSARDHLLITAAAHYVAAMDAHDDKFNMLEREMGELEDEGINLLLRSSRDNSCYASSVLVGYLLIMYIVHIHYVPLINASLQIPYEPSVLGVMHASPWLFICCGWFTTLGFSSPQKIDVITELMITLESYLAGT